MIFFIQRVIQHLRPINVDLSDDSQNLTTEFVQVFLKSDILRQETRYVCWTPFPFPIILNGPTISFA